MTLIISVISKQGVWQCSDHRLSNSAGVVVGDTSIKNIQIEAKDGKAIIAYSGIGKVNTQHISDWMQKLLRGRERTIAEHLAHLVQYSKTHLVGHLKTLKTPHIFTVVGYENSKPVLYRIGYVPHKGITFDRSERYVLSTKKAKAVFFSGSGSKAVKRFAYKIAKATEKRRIQAIPAILAYYNKLASNAVKSVSPHCMVTSLIGPDSGFDNSFHYWPNGVEKPSLNHIAGSTDMTELLRVTLPVMMEHLSDVRNGTADSDKLKEKMDGALSKGNFEPTDKLG